MSIQTMLPKMLCKTPVCLKINTFHFFFRSERVVRRSCSEKQFEEEGEKCGLEARLFATSDSSQFCVHSGVL